MANSNQRPGLRVGFIGMGAMGSRMANRLLAAHFDLTVYNRTREHTRPLQQRGAKVAATPKEVAAEVNVVLSCVANNGPTRLHTAGDSSSCSRITAANRVRRTGSSSRRSIPSMSSDISPGELSPSSFT